MSDRDLFREVEEDLRREQLKSIWDKFGALILATALLIIVSVGGYEIWQYWQEKRSANYGAQFIVAQSLSDDGKTSESLKAFGDLAKEASRGYSHLAEFRLAAEKAVEGDQAGAVAAYDKLAKELTVDYLFRDFAKIQAGFLRVDEASFEEMKTRLLSVASSAGQWRHSARELMGLSAYRAGAIKDAEKYYNEILADQASPEGIRQRAGMMLALMIERDAKNTARKSDE